MNWKIRDKDDTESDDAVAATTAAEIGEKLAELQEDPGIPTAEMPALDADVNPLRVAPPLSAVGQT
jgi:hypothetical protein